MLATKLRYLAAKSWNLPVLSVEWLVESCVLGVRAAETEFYIENEPPFDTQQFIANLDKVRHTDDFNASANSTVTAW